MSKMQNRWGLTTPWKVLRGCLFGSLAHCPKSHCFHWPCEGPGTKTSWITNPNLFSTRNHFRGREFSTDGAGSWWFPDDSSTLHLLCTLFLLSWHQLHLDHQALDPGGWGPLSWTISGPDQHTWWLLPVNYKQAGTGHSCHRIWDHPFPYWVWRGTLIATGRASCGVDVCPGHFNKKACCIFTEPWMWLMALPFGQASGKTQTGI